VPVEKDAKVVAIAGAGPAGLTAALELLRRSDVIPIVFESDGQVGGISKTINYRGNRMDLGGHRFFSKSDWVMRWWQDILPVAENQIDPAVPLRTTYQGQSKEFIPRIGASSSPDAVMLVRQRLSRIFYRRRFFDYPLKLSTGTLTKMGALETFRIGLSYARARVVHRRPDKSLEDFFINRFGDRLYRTFFKDYTEKVWGVPCGAISAEWGEQRIKGLSVGARTRRDESISWVGHASEANRNQLDRKVSLSQIGAGSNVGGGGAQGAAARGKDSPQASGCGD
jgi:protoporphyrinogen oxidase